MATNISRFLIVTNAGRLRDSLRVLLKSCFPQILIEEVETGTAALQLLMGTAQPFLILLDAALPEGQSWQLLEQMGSGHSLSRCLVLSHSLEQQKQAQGAGAEGILLDGFTAESLLAAVTVEGHG
jgi:DNA-binding NarL/FixJ family response regulator